MVKIYLEQFSGQILLENTSEGKHCFRFLILHCITVNIKPSFNESKCTSQIWRMINSWAQSYIETTDEHYQFSDWKTKKYHTFLLRFWYLCFSRNSGIKLFKCRFIDLGLIVWLKSANAGMIVKLKFKLCPDQALETKW